MYCESCKIGFDENLRYCKWCGQALMDTPQSVEAQTCPACRASVQPGLTFCTVCGYKLTLAQSSGTQVMGSITVPEDQPRSDAAHHCTACGESLEPNTAYCKSCGTPIYLEFNPSAPQYPQPAPPQQSASPRTRFDSSKLPDLGTRIQETQHQGTVEMSSGFAPTGLESGDSGLIFSPSGSLEKPVEEIIARPVEPTMDMAAQETVKLEPDGEETIPRTIAISSDVIRAGLEAIAEETRAAETEAITPQIESDTSQMDSMTSQIESDTSQIESDTLQVESDTVPIKPRSRSGVDTGKLTEYEWSEEQHPIVSLDKGRPTSVLQGLPVAEETIEDMPVSPPPVVVFPPVEPSAQSPTADLFDFSEVRAVERETIEQASPTGTAEFASPASEQDQSPANQLPDDGRTMIIASDSIGTGIREETIEQMPPLVEKRPEIRPTAPVGPPQPPIESIPVTGTYPSAPSQPHQQPSGLNDAARSAFGIGERQPPVIQEPAPRDYPAQMAYSPDVVAAKIMPPPSTAPRRSHLPILSIIIAVVLIGAAGLALWYYSATIARNAPKPIDVTVTQPETPTTPTQPETPAPPVAPVGMVFIPGGTYTIGTDTGDELAQPAHKVEVSPFFIDVTEVTNAGYKSFIDATGRQAPEGWENGSYPEGKANWPVTGVTWQDAADYAKWADKRLPTEAEWETAARGKEGNIYPWGNVWGEGMANLRTDSITEVGKYKQGASPFGLLDMIGNVWEWTADSFAPYPGSPASTAGLLEPGITYRVIRGGAYDRRENTEASYRGFIDASKGYGKTGFRCAKDVK